MGKNKVTPLKPTEPLLEEDLGSIGKTGAVSWRDRVLTIEHPTWMNAIGTEYVQFSEFLAEQLVIHSSHEGTVSQKEMAFMTEGLMGLQPKDHVESMLGVQMLATHQAMMTNMRRMNNAPTVDAIEAYNRIVNKLGRTYTAQVEALKKYRTGGKQHVTVKHVHVHEGGQAIVGNVTTGGK